MFNIGRTRVLESVDLDLRSGTIVQFTFQRGGSGCDKSGFGSEYPLLQYSLDGGGVWSKFQKITAFSAYTFYTALPVEAKTSSTRLRWYLSNSAGTDKYVWSLDNVFIDSLTKNVSVFDSFEPMR